MKLKWGRGRPQVCRRETLLSVLKVLGYLHKCKDRYAAKAMYMMRDGDSTKQRTYTQLVTHVHRPTTSTHKAGGPLPLQCLTLFFALSVKRSAASRASQTVFCPLALSAQCLQTWGRRPSQECELSPHDFRCSSSAKGVRITGAMYRRRLFTQRLCPRVSRLHLRKPLSSTGSVDTVLTRGVLPSRGEKHQCADSQTESIFGQAKSIRACLVTYHCSNG